MAQQQTLAQMVRAKYPGAYDDLDDAALDAQVRAKFPGVYDDIPSSGSKKPEPETETPSQVKLAAESVGRFGKRIAGNVAAPVLHPIETGQAILTAPYQIAASHMAEAQAAFDAFQRGDRTEGTLKAIASVIPVVGPMMDQFVTRTMAGEGPEVAADITTLAAGPAAVKKLAPSSVGLRAAPVASEEAQAVRFAQGRGVPVDVATQSGNAFLRNVQQMSEKATLAGGAIGKRGQEAVKTGLATLGEQLASKAGRGQPATMLGAGEEAASTIRKRIADLSKEADQAYEPLRRAEKDGPMIGINVQTAKEKVRPVYDQLVRESKLAQPTGATKTALLALDRLMSGPNVAPMSVVDGALSELKSALRAAGDSQPWSKGVGALRATVQALDKEVMDVAAIYKLDKELAKGRAATVNKYQAIEVLDQLGTEPAAAVAKVLAQKDRGVSQLRALRREAPEAVGEMGRALLDDLLAKAKEGKHDTVMTQWQGIGEATKRELFGATLKKNPDYLSNLNQFFRASKELQKSMNPSGTASASLAAAHAASAASGNVGLSLAYELLGAGTASALRSPRIARALANGLRVPVKTPATRAAVLNSVARAFQAEGLPVPAFASTEKEPRR